MTVGMTPLSTPGLVMMGDLNNRREEKKEIKERPLIIVGKTPLSTLGQVMRGDVNDSRQRTERKLSGNT